MWRQITAKLVQWKSKKARLPLILQGARQIGKTHSLKDFAEQEQRIKDVHATFGFSTFRERLKRYLETS